MKVVKVIVALGVGLAVAGGAAYAFWLKPQLEFAEIATAFAAKKVCSCLHVAERPMEQCKVDFTDDVSMATFIADGDQGADGAHVRAEVLGGRISARAVHTKGQGCKVVPNT